MIFVNPNSEGTLDKGNLSIGVMAMAIVMAILVSFYVSSHEAYGAETDDGLARSAKERALLERGAREIMGLDEGDVDRILSDPETAAYVPVSIESSSRYVEAPASGGEASGSRSLSAASDCVGESKSKQYTQRFIDETDEPAFKFTATKVWCYSDGEVTYGNMGPAETWVRPDLRHSEAQGGWRYSPTSEFGEETFVPYDGRARGAHKSSRAGAFLYSFPGEDVTSAATLAGVNQIGFSTGGCNSDHFEPVVPKITDGPSGSVASRSAAFEFTAGRNASYECDLDGNGFRKCTSPKQFDSLSQGNHTFKVRATSADGNASVIAKRDWTVNTASPRVASTTPTDGATGVAPRGSISAVFSKDIDELSLYGGNFTLRESEGGAVVDGAISYNPQTKTALLNPFENLKPGASYTARVRGGDSGVTDNTGLALAQGRVWSFTVGGS